MSRGHLARVALIFTLALCARLPAHGPEHVLVVANGNSADSVAIADHYLTSRGIPEANLVVLDCPEEETISREVFERTIHQPLLQRLRGSELGERIRFVVTTKGIPLRVAGTGSPQETATQAAVDSELTLMRWELVHPEGVIPREGPLLNPYFNADGWISGGASFDPDRWPIHLVTRLTGFSVDDALALIDRAQSPGPRGVFAIDLMGSPPGAGFDDRILRHAASILRNLDESVLLESSATVLNDVEGLSGYASWGSNDINRRSRHLSLGFLPGAIACTLVSTSARTFEEPDPDWDLPGNWDDRDLFWAGSPQSLTGDLIRQGATGASGNVWEPLIEGTARPDIALAAYATGHTLAESFYLSMPFVSWMGVVVGDPLCCLSPKNAEVASPSGRVN